MGDALTRAHLRSLENHLPNEHKPPNHENLTRDIGEDRVLETRDEMVVMPKHIENEMETDGH